MVTLLRTVELLAPRRMIAPVRDGHHRMLALPFLRPYSTGKRDSRTTRNGQSSSVNARGPPPESAEAQDFYNYYLAKKLRDYTLREVTGTWLEALVLGRARASTPTQEDGDPLKVLSDMDANMETAIGSLERIIGSAHRAEKDKDTVRETFDTQQLGHKALLWLQNSEAYKRHDLLLYPKFIKLVAHALAAQKADDYLWHLMLVPELPASFSTSELYATKWKSQVLRALVEACAYWTPDHDAFNKSYACFKRAFKTVAELRKQPYLYVPKASAGTFLETLFLRGQRSYVDVGVFDGFLSTLKTRTTSDPFTFEFKKSRMYLKHPETPNADFALNLLREVSKASSRSNAINDILGQRGAKGSSMLFMYYIQAAQLLDKQGRTQDARWVLDFARSEMPTYFTKGHQNPFEGKAETFQKRPPPEYEKKMGVPIDKDGYLSIDAQGKDYWRAAKAAEYDRRLAPRGR